MNIEQIVQLWVSNSLVGSVKTNTNLNNSCMREEILVQVAF